MARKYQKYSPEFREQAARRVVDGGRPICEVAREYGLGETTLGNWVKKYRLEHATEEPALELSERAELQELRRRTREQEMELAFLKSGGVLREGAAVSEKYEFIAAEYAHHQAAGDRAAPALSQMLSWLGVSKAGFYEWRHRRPSAAERRRSRLRTKIGELFEWSGATYGHRRIHAELVAAGELVGPELVRALMRELGLVPVQPRPFRTTTVRGAEEPDSPDLVQREFTADRPGTKLVGDITYVPTWQGWLYLATVIDCFNKEVIGYAMVDHMRTELVTDALGMANQNHIFEPNCIMHSDRGTQYTSAEYLAVLNQLHLRHSLGRTGVCWDNALAESFFATLKTERVHHMVYPTREKAAADIARYIELHYNRRRIHSALGYRTPHGVRNEYLNQQAAA